MQPPIARSRGITAQGVGEEIVLIDAPAGDAHTLPRLSAQVWRLADGTRSIDVMASELSVPRELVGAAVADLAAAGLLDSHPAAIDRRAMLARTAVIGTGAALVAPIVSLALPSLAAAASPSTSYVIAFGTYQYGGSPDIVTSRQQPAVTPQTAPGYAITVSGASAASAYAFYISGTAYPATVNWEGQANSTFPGVGGGETITPPSVVVNIDASHNLILTFSAGSNPSGSATYKVGSSGPVTSLVAGTATTVGASVASATLVIHDD